MSHHEKLFLPYLTSCLFPGLTLDRLELHDIGLPEGACASGIKQLALTNPRWDDLRIAMSSSFCPDLQVISIARCSGMLKEDSQTVVIHE